jgi:Ca2+-binding RTX toxin-like protein
VLTFLRSALLAIVLGTTLIGGAATASATVKIDSISDGTLTVAGSDGNDEPQFDYYTSSGPNYTRIFDGGGVVGDLPDGCVHPDPDPAPIPQDSDKVALCEDGGTSPALTHLVLVLFDGVDHPHFNECFNQFDVFLGEGATNRATPPPGCAGGVFNVTGGSGQDTVAVDGVASSDLNVNASLGAGNDSFLGGDGNDTAHGGEGNDTLASSAGNDQHFGDGGNDDIKGGPGNDVEDGGPGDDQVGGRLGLSSGRDNDQGADTLRGGPGNDGLVLESHAGGMAISIDGQANDGTGAEGDNVGGDFEQIDGTNGNDVFHGSAGGDRFLGGGGNDEIHGGDGADDLDGEGGDDRVYGDAGNDKVQGSYDSDVVDGGPGGDQIYGDIAGCSVFCNADPDQLFARDGERDVVDCGSGADTAQVDTLDVVAFCATVDRQNVTGGPAAPGAASPLAVAKSVKLKTLIRRGLVLRYKCAAACKVVATLSYKGKRLGAGRKTLRKKGTARVVVRIARKSRRKVRRLRGKKLTLRVKVTSKRRTTTLTRKVKLKR